MEFRHGAPFHGQFASADASALSEANSRFTLQGAGSATALTLGTNDQVVITDIIVTSGGAITVSIYDGADATVDAGEQIAVMQFAANGNLSLAFAGGYFCSKGTYPKVKGSAAGQINCTIQGFIINRSNI